MKENEKDTLFSTISYSTNYEPYFEQSSTRTQTGVVEGIKEFRDIQNRLESLENKDLEKQIISLTKILKYVCIIFPLIFLIMLGAYLFITDKQAATNTIIAVGTATIIINIVGIFIKNIKN